MIIGYCRVSTHDQCLDRQTDILTDAGCERIYQEKISGATKERPELQRMFDALREGDTVVVTELSRLSRTVKDFRRYIRVRKRSHQAAHERRFGSCQGARQEWWQATDRCRQIESGIKDVQVKRV